MNTYQFMELEEIWKVLRDLMCEEDLFIAHSAQVFGWHGWHAEGTNEERRKKGKKAQSKEGTKAEEGGEEEKKRVKKEQRQKKEERKKRKE